MGQYYNMGNYFMLAHPYGTPKVMSSYYFTDTDAGPPSVAVHADDGTVNCDDGVNWVCEHRRAGIANMVKFRSVAGTAEATNWLTDSSNGALRSENCFFPSSQQRHACTTQASCHHCCHRRVHVHVAPRKPRRFLSRGQGLHRH